MKVDLVLPTGSTIGRSGQAANARLVNAYAEPSGKDGKSSFSVYVAPGNRRWDASSFTGANRGLIELNSDALIAILGNEIVSFDQVGVPTVLSAIVGTKRLHMSRNRNAAPQITMTTEAGQSFVLQSGVLTQVTDPDLPAAVSNAYLSGYTLYGIADGRIFASALENSSSIAAGAFGNSRADDSRLMRVFPDSNYLYVFNEKGIEIWQPNANAPNPAFPFSPIQQTINIGCGAPHSVVSISGHGLAWVDNLNNVRLGRDAGAALISSHTVSRAIESLTQTQREDIYGYVRTYEGHEVYRIRSDVWAWDYSTKYQEWFEAETYGREGSRINAHELFNGMHILGSDEDGKLYRLDISYGMDGASPHVMEVCCAHSHRFPGSMIVDALEVDAIGGVGLNTGVLADDDPQLMIDYSDDGGATFEGERFSALGTIGNRTVRIRENGWGLVSEPGRIWRFRASAAVLRGLMAAALYGRKAS